MRMADGKCRPMDESERTDEPARKRGPHTSGTWVEPRYDQDQSQFPAGDNEDPCESAEAQAAMNQPVLLHRIPGGGHHGLPGGNGTGKHPPAGADEDLRRAERPGQ